MSGFDRRWNCSLSSLKPLFKVVAIEAFIAVIFYSFIKFFLVSVDSASIPYRFGLITYRKPAIGHYALTTIPATDPLYGGERIVKRVTCEPGCFLHVTEEKYYCRCQDSRFGLLEFEGGQVPHETSNGTKLGTFTYMGDVPEGCYFLTGDNIRSYDSRQIGFFCENIWDVIVF